MTCFATQRDAIGANIIGKRMFETGPSAAWPEEAPFRTRLCSDHEKRDLRLVPVGRRSLHDEGLNVALSWLGRLRGS